MNSKGLPFRSMVAGPPSSSAKLSNVQKLSWQKCRLAQGWLGRLFWYKNTFTTNVCRRHQSPPENMTSLTSFLSTPKMGASANNHATRQAFDKKVDMLEISRMEELLSGSFCVFPELAKHPLNIFETDSRRIATHFVFPEEELCFIYPKLFAHKPAPLIKVESGFLKGLV